MLKKKKIERWLLLTQKIDEYRNKLQNRIGKEFESLIKFVKGETEEIETDKEQTLKNFIKIIRPILKEALKI